MPDQKKTQSRCLRFVLVLTLLLALTGAVHVSAALLDPLSIPKWENNITGPPPVYEPVNKSNYYEVNVSEFQQTILPPSMGLQPTCTATAGWRRTP